MEIKYKKQNGGIALISVLAILAMLAIIASVFARGISQNLASSSLQKENVKLDLLQKSALAHTEALMSSTDLTENGTEFLKSKLINKNTFKPINGQIGCYGEWVYLKDDSQNLIGRYCVAIEDEAAKVNLHVASRLTDSKSMAWDNTQVNLVKALGVSDKVANKILEFKYGKDQVAGGRGDDNSNNPKLIVDKIDNNGDNIVDEIDEGINEPMEYSAISPRGDDRTFTTFREISSLIVNSSELKKVSVDKKNKFGRALSKRATIYSKDKPGSPTLPIDDSCEINTINAKEARRRLVSANKKVSFEKRSRSRSQLAANLIDYRDENHVLTTVGGSVYGVEAICFNEVMANDASSAYTSDDGFAHDSVFGNRNPWIEDYDSVDGERLIYSPSAFYTDSASATYSFEGSDVAGGTTLWNIKDEARKKLGKISISGNTVNFTLPPGPGKYGSASKPLFETARWAGNDPASLKQYYKDTLAMMRKRGKVRSDHLKFPDNHFKNQEVYFYQWAGSKIGTLKVTKSSNHKFTATGVDASKILQHINSVGTNLSVIFESWGLGKCAELPEVSLYDVIRSRSGNPGEYFQIQIARDPSGPKNSFKANTLNISGDSDNGKFTEEDAKLWYYNDGKPLKTDNMGFIDVYITSSPKVNAQKKICQPISYFRMIAPEVVEMYNASATPVSLANWRVVCNTGSMAKEIGRIKRTAHYDRVLRKRMVDVNPMVMPQSHFYLVNDTQLFDARYGNADNVWGSVADEEVPVFQMDKKHWGVAFKIKNVVFNAAVDHTKCKVYIEKGLSGDEDFFKGETLKFIYPNKNEEEDSWDGALVLGEAEGDYIEVKFSYPAWENGKVVSNGTLPDENGHVMICGLPAKGGIVSLTLKNEYDQVTARTVEYGSVERTEFGFSTEKEDPTHYTWIKQENPTIGGTDREAINRSMRGHKNAALQVKNAPYACIAELKNLRTSDDFVNLGSKGGDKSGLQKLGALADVLSFSHIRLESCDGNAEITGWIPALYTVSAHDVRIVKAENANWEINQWKGQTLRFLTGPISGEKFAILSNNRNSIILGDPETKQIPRSAPNRKAIRGCRGAKFTVGPGYHTPMCYNRKNGQEGTWLWRKAIPYPGTYDFYLHGLSDSIYTTEFLEENDNAEMDVFLWNYKNNDWDEIAQRLQYYKEDSANAGKIYPDNISPDGDIKLKLIAFNLVSSGLKNRGEENDGNAQGFQSGYAWFNYMTISPLPVAGRINFNTAPARLLASIPGISSELAKNIESGIDINGRPTLKPYLSFSDLLKVQGFNLDIFEKSVNLIALNSYVYTVDVKAETINDVNGNGEFDPAKDKIVALNNKRYIVDIEPSDGDYKKVELLEKY